MESTEKSVPGKKVVIAILGVATLGASLTWIRYTAQVPSTENAQLVSDRVVIATFDARAARNLHEGTKAIVTFEASGGRRFSGTVHSLQTQHPQITAVILLRDIPENAQPHSRCNVTVDTSVDSEALDFY
jgi:multidrug resistance efflux pump